MKNRLARHVSARTSSTLADFSAPPRTLCHGKRSLLDHSAAVVVYFSVYIYLKRREMGSIPSIPPAHCGGAHRKRARVGCLWRKRRTGAAPCIWRPSLRLFADLIISLAHKKLANSRMCAPAQYVCWCDLINVIARLVFESEFMFVEYVRVFIALL